MVKEKDIENWVNATLQSRKFKSTKAKDNYRNFLIKIAEDITSEITQDMWGKLDKYFLPGLSSYSLVNPNTPKLEIESKVSCKNFHRRNEQAYFDCSNKDLKQCQMKSASFPSNKYEGKIVLICKYCRKGIENGQFKLVK